MINDKNKEDKTCKCRINGLTVDSNLRFSDKTHTYDIGMISILDLFCFSLTFVTSKKCRSFKFITQKNNLIYALFHRKLFTK
jgi:hypothetical protein